MPDLLRHEALPYSGHDQFVSSSVAVLRDALDRDERLIFFADAKKVEDVRQALDDDRDDVTLVATDEHGRNPSRIITLLDNFRAGGDGRRALGLGESVQAAQGPATRSEALLADSLYNSERLSTWPMSIVCLYDLATLDDDSVTAMRRSHPVVRGGGTDPGGRSGGSATTWSTDTGTAFNPDYEERLLGALFREPLPPPPPGSRSLEIAGAQLVGMREFVRSAAGRDGVAPDRVDDLVLAANEIVTNSLRHGGGRCTLTVWHDGGTTVCQAQDPGILRDPLAGRLAPAPDAVNGRGLWLANHLCDLVQIRSSERMGTVVRLAVDGPSG